MFRQIVLALPVVALAACSTDPQDTPAPQSMTHPMAAPQHDKQAGAAPNHTDAPHWSYDGANGPQHWGSLDAAFSACSDGRNQSPINLTRMIKGELTPIKFAYKPGGTEILHNGHTIQVNYAPGSSITVDGVAFELKQFHFHAPSENTIQGHSYPLEGHFVHADAKGNLAVIAVMYMVEKPLPELDKAWKHMPAIAGETRALPAAVSASALLPAERGYYRFTGSLTTPPCSEGVRWLVMNTYKEISAAQVDAFTRVMHHPNNRPIQPLNARTVLK
jgi:carbonic anhydrase